MQEIAWALCLRKLSVSVGSGMISDTVTGEVEGYLDFM